MTITTRLSVRLSKRAIVPAFRGQRQFSSARSMLKEIQDAYIISASRTPTAKVC
jgi:acetyl-CoA C-acetyltransferase